MYRKFLRIQLALMVVLSGLLMSRMPTLGAQDGTYSQAAQHYAKLQALHQQGRDTEAIAYFADLSPKQQQAVIDGMTDISVSYEIVAGTTTPSEPPAATQREGVDAVSESEMSAAACWGPYTYSSVYENGFGVVTMRYYQQMQWCGGSYITGAWCSAWSGDTAWGYNFQGHDSYCEVTLGGTGRNTIKYFSQGRYQACIEWCLKTYHPWVSQQGAVNGGYWAWAG